MVAESVIQKKSFQFALLIIELYKNLCKKGEFILSKQLLRSGTSIGANVEEATAGQSRKDFLAKMSIASKEARETKYWLRLLQQSRIVEVDVEEALSQVEELVRMLAATVKTTERKIGEKKSLR